MEKRNKSSRPFIRTIRNKFWLNKNSKKTKKRIKFKGKKKLNKNICNKNQINKNKNGEKKII